MPNIYLRLRLCFANTINVYLRLKMSVMCKGSFKPLMCIHSIFYTKTVTDLSFISEVFKTSV